jgi:hypothetical protein
MSGKSFDQVEILFFEGAKYVAGESLAKTLDKNSATWLKWQIHRQNLLLKKDYIYDGENILFSMEAAAMIFAKVHKPKVEKSDRPKKSRYGYDLDEYGLPILPPQKRRGVLINPYRI